MPKIGFLYPGFSAEDDYPTAQRLLAAGTGRGAGPATASGPAEADPDRSVPELVVVHTEMREDAHRVDALLAIGADDVLAEGVRRLGRWPR